MAFPRPAAPYAGAVAAIHPKAMPVILTTPEEVETWLTAPPQIALELQRPLPDGALQIVARGKGTDGPEGEPAARPPEQPNLI